MEFKNLFDMNAISGIVKDVLKQVNSDIYTEFNKINERLDRIEATIQTLNTNKNTTTNNVATENTAATVPAEEVKVIKLSKRGRRIKEPKICAKEGCTKPAKCKGLCTYHYQCSRKAIRAQEELSGETTKAPVETVAPVEPDMTDTEIEETIQPVIRKREDIENEAINATAAPEENVEETSESPNYENMHPSFSPIV